jgi:Flp pilus assembly pilin Flp
MKQQLRKLPRAFKAFCRDERGQSTTEYILILAVVVMISMKFKAMFTSSLGQAIQNVGGSIDSATSSSNSN